ncbi:hypothetical protein B566_EDAN004640 [Ephemera danica]|nr:hypothetical protein B566_EDAN004640 [Ephemera danica]
MRFKRLQLQGAMIPEPEFPPPPPMPEDVQRDGEGLILPRKPHNPCIESGDHKSLHREILFNQKVGKNVLNQKSELQRAMERHKEQAARKEAEKDRVNNKTAFERVIEERARRLETLEKQEETEREEEASQPEFLQVHAKLRARMDSK